MTPAASPATNVHGGVAGPVRGVIFDWGGTISPWHDYDLRAPWEAFARGYGTMACAFNDLTARLVRAADETWARSRSEQVPARMTDVLEAVGLDAASPAGRAGLAAYWEFMEQHTVTHPAICCVWETLRDKGIRVGILSNTIWSAAEHRAFLERDGVLDLVDADLWSSEMTVTKPHAEAFRAAAAALGLPVQECVYVGDRLFEDVHGAHRAGMRAIWIPHSRIPAEQLVEVDDQPDAVAQELTDIPGIVQGWSSGA